MQYLRATVGATLVAFSLTSGILHSDARDGSVLSEWLADRVAKGLDYPAVAFKLRSDLNTITASANTITTSGTSQSVPEGTYVQTRFDNCTHHFPQQQLPVVPAAPALRELCFSAFAILHSGVYRTPVFVVQKINRQMLERAGEVPRTDRFYAEARLPGQERAELSDYRNSGYARGHMAPAGDMHDETAMAQSFSLANIVPQDPTQNAGAWNLIEQDTRKYVRRARGDVYIFTGPVYEANPRRIGEGRVAVPDYVYKLVYDPARGAAWVHWQQNGPAAQAGPPITYDEFVSRTGLHLLSPVRASESRVPAP